MKNSTISIILKILLLICLLVGMNELYRLFFYEDDIQKHSDIINLVRTTTENDDEIIYVGESSNISTRGDDIDKRSISSFIADYFPDLKMGDLTKPASHAGIYYELLRNIPTDSKVKTVIVTLNLRSFNASWIYSSLETPLQKSIVLLKGYPPLWNRFLLSFKGYYIKTELEQKIRIHYEWRYNTFHFPYSFPYNNVENWDQAKANEGVKNEDGIIDYPLTILACHFIKTYAFQIDTLKNPRIKDFDRIAKLAQERNWNLIFNLMAENVEMAEILVGKDLLYLMKQNRDLLVDRYQKMGVTVVDNFSAVADEEFVDRDWTTEHYAEKGRKIVARNVAKDLQTFYPNYFKDVQYNTEKKRDFFNNCENDDPWGQWHTLSTDNPFSGKKSSKTGYGEDYGLTFEYGIKNLPDSLQTVSVEMWVFQKDLAHNAQIMLEITGLRTVGIPLQNITKEVNKWEKVNCNFELGEDFYSNKIVKIFLYNPYNTTIFCDDLRVIFY